MVDTNILARLAHKGHPHTSVANAALHKLWSEGHELRVVPQVLYEYWSVATRPSGENGLGFTVEVAHADVTSFKHIFAVLRDERGVLEPWQGLVLRDRVLGKQSHDARLVAAMQRHSLTHLITFNISDFRRYQGIEVIDPHAVAAS